MRRLVAVVMAALAAWLGLVQPAQAVPGGTTAPVAAHAYDDHEHPMAVTNTSTERGPPAAHERDTTYDYGQLSFGTSQLPNVPTSPATHDYDDLARLVQIARGSGRAREQVGRAEAGPVVAQRPGVAANAGSRLLSPSSLADEVVNATGGVLKTNKGGFTVEIPHGARGITVRVMERGGSRTNYYRVSVPGKETYTVTGEASTDAALTHIGITESSLDDILSIVARIQGGG